MSMSQLPEANIAVLEQHSQGLNALTDLRKALPEENNIIYQRKWVYGYWFKVKYMRRIAERHKLDWQKHGSKLVDKFVTSLAYSTGIFFDAHAAIYQGQPALILAFAEDDDRRRLDHIEFSESEIDKIRRGIGLPAGTKPRWYELSGKGTDPDEEVESEDETYPDETGRTVEVASRPRNIPNHVQELMSRRMEIY
ncbi:uncharacterized protein FOMMEDRAFT_144790 [Fomitiporia mediterranea MF3/22]|uniref:uncharacterized protein n=1 Tax=Fomitiporia mediterranea (strain MF3/22) TaxID=694068 RepID=UPI000440849A|nr:uncharacterized protein FOMMEDRAFT_144790 [Fomitiporia mediterranea MF3/22]EJD06970.1 hypothetical protein FOMMEDRAFT_144790 [Fomitiporia mediterranea MF3/22]